MNLPSQILPFIADASLRGGIIIFLLLALRPWLRRFFGSACVSMLWLVVLARLLMLWPVESPWSAFNLWPKTQSHAVTETPWKISVSVNGDAVEKSRLVQSAQPLPARQSNRLAIFGAIWALGSTGMFLYFCVRGWRTARIARRTQSANDPRLQKVFASIPYALRGRTTLRVTDEVSIPALVGIWRPQIWLPRNWLAALSDDELRHVLLHELGHARRADLAVQWLFAIAQCVHWFNPLVWLAARFARTDAELACDAWVLARSGEPERESYGGTLLKTSQLFRTRLSISPVAIGMAASRQTLVARVRHVGEYCAVPRWRVWLGLVVAAIAAVALMTNQTSAQDPAAPTATSTPATTPAATPSAENPGPKTRQQMAAEKMNPTSDEPKPSATPVLSASPAVEKPAQQIEIEAKFFEVPEAVAKKLGLISTGSKMAPSADADKKEGNVLSKLPADVPLVSLNSVLNQQAVDELLKKLNGEPRVDLLSAPRVTTKSGQRATVEVVREMRYPTEFEPDKKSPTGMVPTAFETRNVGVTLEVEPVVNPQGDTIDLTMIPQVVEFLGFLNYKDNHPANSQHEKSEVAAFAHPNLPAGTFQPVFSTRKMTTSVTLQSGQSILLGGLARKDKQLVEEKGVKSREVTVSRILYMLITARRVDVYGKILLTPPPITSTPAPAPPKPDMPFGIIRPGDKAGFARSPFKPDDGMIDLRGFPPGTEVKDPYSGKIFLVPNPAPNPAASDSPSSFKVTILGEVNKPGVYTVDAGLSLASIIAEAQGFTKLANEKKINVIAKDGLKTVVDFKANPVSYILQPGDVVSVEERLVNF